jgi:hypothetical protein
MSEPASEPMPPGGAIDAAHKVAVRASLVKLLFHRRTERGMTLIPEQSRCVRAGEVHELLTTDHSGLTAGSRVDQVGFLGFVELGNAGVLDVGDHVLVSGRQIGVVAGFDACHFPNHYNIVVAATALLTAADLDLALGQTIAFVPGTVPPEGA